MKKVSTNFIYFFGALGGLLFGYDTGVISGAILFIEKQMHLGSWGQGMVVSGVLLGAMIGSLVIGPSSDRYGRRKLLLLSSIIFIIGGLGCAFASNALILILFRVVLGLAVGAASSMVPTYLAELSPAVKRGVVSSLFQVMVMTGIFLAYVVNWGLQGFYTGWRWMLGLAALPATIMFLGGLFLPESPRYLVKIGKLDEAKAVLMNINKGDQQAVIVDLEKITEQVNMKNEGLKELFGPMVRPALIAAIGLTIFQQVMGCNTVLYYAPTIFTDVGFGVNAALLAHLGIGIFNVIVTIIAMSLMDKIDRKKMLIWGGLGMGISLFVMSLGMKFSGGSKTAAIICVLAMTIYIAFFSATWGPVMWVMLGEIFPLNIRGLGNSFGSFVNWFANMIVSLTFPFLLDFFGTGSLFIGYGILCFLGIWFVHTMVFETRGRSLEDIEESLREKATAKDGKALKTATK